MSLNTNNQRVSFASVKSHFPYPDFLEVQLKSFRDFFQLDTATEHRKNEGMYKVFAENFPCRRDEWRYPSSGYSQREGSAPAKFRPTARRHR